MSANQANSNSSGKTVVVLSVLLIIAMMAFVMFSFLVIRDGQRDTAYREAAGELRVLMEQVAASSREATEGSADAFVTLDNARQGFGQSLALLTEGEGRLPPVPTMLEPQTGALNSLWSETGEAAQTIVVNRERILFLHEVARTLNESIPELQQEYNFVVEILIESRSPSDQVALAERQLWLAERIARNVDKMLQGGVDAKDAADQFNLDASTFGSVLAGMLSGNAAMRIAKVKDPEARASLTQISELYEFVNNSVDKIFQASPDLLNARASVNQILINTPQIQVQTGQLTDGIERLDEQRPITAVAVVGAGLAVILLLAAFGILASMNTNTRLRSEEQANERNQMAILRLLDELSDLADGDLTAKATVTEDFTGAIADSVNFTIDQLRILVSRINSTAVEVSQSAQDTQTTALNLAGAAEHQAQEIAGASAAINEMAVTIDQVSANAAESANVADRSVQIASTGAEVVQNTIHGMDTIREQIQDTSKRIKRLGESSQEIGDIVSLINDIADQTNILSLNAAIQASMAGDAGRGFAVVADEVQRLAERSSAATKQIETLVKTIQADTNEAVISMEQTTSEVVRGARLAQNAGVALEEIENVSQSLAELIQNISNAARQQAASAGHISSTMTVIQEITSQTSNGTTATARSVGTLAEMAVVLQDSVAGFKLPDGTTIDADLGATGEYAALPESALEDEFDYEVEGSELGEEIDDMPLVMDEAPEPAKEPELFDAFDEFASEGIELPADQEEEADEIDIVEDSILEDGLDEEVGVEIEEALADNTDELSDDLMDLGADFDDGLDDDFDVDFDAELMDFTDDEKA